MSDVIAARSQMAMSLAFHIIFAVVAIGMPALMVVAERRWQVTGDPVYLDLARRWAKGTGILFAVGAVSGTVLSFELGLLWPGFMRLSGAVIGMPFSLEGFAFFTEAIFLGVYLYGRERVRPRAHLAAGVLVAISGAASALFVVTANAWMNAPTGFRIVGNQPTDVHPLQAMANAAAPSEVLHMLLAAYAATGLVVVGIHAALLLRDPGSAFHRRALGVALVIGAPAAILQPISGDFSARHVARDQPAKLAALEGQFRTEAGAALHIGGIPDVEREETRGAIEIPHGLSLLAFHDPSATVTGLHDIPRDLWPPVVLTHIAFQLMVGMGLFMAFVSIGALWRLARQGEDGVVADRWLLRALVVAAPMGFLAIEAGWIVTEVGRQPWIIYGILRTADALTPMPGLIVPFVTFTLLYCFLGVIVAWLLYQQVIRSPRSVA